MVHVITTDFFTHCCASARRLKRLCKAWLVFWALGLLGASAWAQSGVEVSQFRVEKAEDGVVLSAQLQFELSAAVEDALLKGIPMVFVSSADVLRERWYWYDKKVIDAERHFRIAYLPLTRKWRLQVGAGPMSANGSGVSLGQVFETLPQVLGAIKRISRWKIAESSELESGPRYRVEFRFYLDVGQLPRPFQIGAIGQTEWDLSATVNAPVAIDSAK